LEIEGKDSGFALDFLEKFVVMAKDYGGKAAMTSELFSDSKHTTDLHNLRPTGGTCS
jgi:hypothetical protein